MKMRKLALSVSLACALLGTQAQAQWWNSQDPTPPKFRGTPLAPKPVYDRHLFEMAQMGVWQFIQSHDFEKIDRMYDEFLRDGKRASDGVLMIDAFRRAFDSLFDISSESELAAFFKEWREKSPASRLLPVAQAHMWEALAWKARGSTGASEVTRGGGDLFKERLRKAAGALEASVDVGKESPIWYWVVLIVAGSSGRPEAQFDTLYNEAVTKFPGYLPLYYTRVNYLLPQWGGNWDKVDGFVADAVARTQAADGTALYAWIYADVNRKSGGNIFGESRLQWPAMKASFEDILKRYPDAWNRGLYATFACLARDRETTARLLLDMPGDVIFTGYAHLTSDECRRFAFDRT